MKKYIILNLTILIGITGGSSLLVQAEEIEKNAKPLVEVSSASEQTLPVSLRKCTSEEIGITFDCDPSWKLNRKERTLKVTISQNPLVEMDIEESEQTIHFISEINEAAFAGMGRYEEGFHFEHLTHCDRETIKISGYLKGHPQARVSDYYLIDHLKMHSVKFTVDPKEAWEDYKWLIKDLADSFHLVKQKQDTKLFAEETDESCEDLVK
jgi:hypothetical protein